MFLAGFSKCMIDETGLSKISINCYALLLARALSALHKRAYLLPLSVPCHFIVATATSTVGCTSPSSSAAAAADAAVWLTHFRIVHLTQFESHRL